MLPMYFNITICLAHLEMSGNLLDAMEMLGNLPESRTCQGKILSGKIVYS